MGGLMIYGMERRRVLLAAKVDLKVVSELLGHSSVAIMADIYAHVLPEMQQEVVDKMDDLFKSSSAR